jgi:hypothetical protein
VRCGRCGNDNSGTNRFCGMCGAPLVPQTQVGGPPAERVQGASAERTTSAPQSALPAQPVPAQPVVRPAAAGAAASAGGAVERRPMLSSFDVAREDEPDREPIISGPSFLGLNKPSARRSGFHADTGREQLRSSGNVDYLLDDEEETKRGWGKILLVLVALTLASGFGYLRWRQGGFDWLKAGDRKPAAAQVAPEAGQNGTDNNSPAGAAPAPGAAAAGGAGTAPAGTTSATGGTAATPADNAGAPSQTSSAQTTSAQPSPPQASPPQNSGPATPSADSAAQNNSSGASQAAGSLPNANTAGAPADTASQTAGSDSAGQSNDSDEEQPAAPKAGARKAATAKPVATKPSAAKPADTVAEAERYVYGSGVRQDCDRGLRMLKTAAGQLDAKAMISLGALYSTGTCAPRDLPTAYRWFAMALHKQPDNQALQDDLQKLWSQMTQPERQLAIKLSQ